MSRKMLIDATHEEETRVAVIEGNRLEEFDYESTFRKALKGNIFLAKVTRVEPSLQAAFVNFGGNRHGFLPFSEIHPDYFRIPIADREALIAEQEKELAELAQEDEADDSPEADLEDDSVEDDVAEDDASDDEGDSDAGDEPVDGEADDAEAANSEDGAQGDDNEDGGKGRRGRYGRGRGRGRGRKNVASQNNAVEAVGGDEINDEQRFRFNMRRKYKIQEVIKRGQIMLVQVSKEERGNKGAAVGSYLSLPGRYCVLMPNSPRGGGVSRKISNFKDRAKMRELLKDLEVPKGMSVILRTAGVTRTKAEVKRDLEYLMRLWDDIRKLTLESSAPALVYEEANLVKRAVRDLYTRDVEEIIVAGEEGYKIAKGFMKMMIPSHVKRVKEFKETNGVSLFKSQGIETQIADIGETTVTLKSGGYLVINPTEALISIDVNSGKSTKERHIEETALKTNLEAAEEVARQLRLRDLGGLVVIDFIDMDHRGNNGKVERRMRDSLAGDRARIQVGKISSFGLMEMSRQRMNPSLNESQFGTCSHCDGTGRLRTADAASIMLLRAIEEEGAKKRAAQIIVHVPNSVALYLLNNKREHLSEIETRYGLSVLIRVDEDMSASGFRIEVSRPADKNAGKGQNNSDTKDSAEQGDNNAARGNSRNSGGDDGDQEGREGRRRGRRGGRNRGKRDENRNDNNDQNAGNQKPKNDHVDDAIGNTIDDAPHNDVNGNVIDNSSNEANGNVKKGDKPKRAPRRKKSDAPAADQGQTGNVAVEPAAKPVVEKKAPVAAPEASNDDAVKDKAPVKAVAAKKSAAKAKAPVAPKAPVVEKPKDDTPKDYETVNEAPKKKKKGWWSK